MGLTDPLPSAAGRRMLVLPHQPLLRRQVARDVLDVMASTWQPGAEVDIDPLLADVARQRPVTRLRRRPVPSFDTGLDVLMDVGEGMQPFRRDQRDMLAALRRLVGPALRVLRYHDVPWDGVRVDGEPDWLPDWPLPPPGRPVVVFGTLGCGARPDPAAVAGWLRAAEVLNRRGSRLSALVPVPRRLWHPALRAARLLVPWDRTTRRRDVRSLPDDPNRDPP